MVAWLQRTVAVSLFNLASLRQRLGQSLVTVIGVGGVVMVMIGVLSIAAGLRKTLSSTGDPESVIVLRTGADSEMTSGFGLESTRIIADAPGVARDAEGPLASAELYVIVDLPKRSTGTPANVPFRGVGERGFAVRPQVKMVEGRRFEPGRNEIVAGRAAAGQFGGLEVGNTLRWGESTWTVVGIFESGGSLEESEVWTDVKVLQPAYRRGNSFQSVHLRVTPGDGFERLRDALSADPRVDVKVMREGDYYGAQGEVLSKLIFTLGGVIGLLMGIGAVFAALNTMYSAVSARAREIATLRALGFGGGTVVVSVMVEALILSLLGGVVGAAVAYLVFNGQQAATLNWQSFSQVAFAFAVTPPLLVGGILYALLMGLVGGLFPAVRAARMPVATALRQL